MSDAPQLAPSKRSAIRSFKVMDVVAKADRLARAAPLKDGPPRRR